MSIKGTHRVIQITDAVRRDVTGKTRIAISMPDPTDPTPFLIDGEVEVRDALREPMAKSVGVQRPEEEERTHRMPAAIPEYPAPITTTFIRLHSSIANSGGV